MMPSFPLKKVCIKPGALPSALGAKYRNKARTIEASSYREETRRNKRCASSELKDWQPTISRMMRSG